MDIKVKGTSKVGILAFDLNDQCASSDMDKARNVQKLCNAISDYFAALRNIRKYDSIAPVMGVDIDNIKQQIQDCEEYYKRLLFTCLSENDAEMYLD